MCTIQIPLQTAKKMPNKELVASFLIQPKVLQSAATKFDRERNTFLD